MLPSGRARWVAVQASSKQTSDPEVCIGALDPRCRQPADGIRLQGSLDSTLSCLEPSGWPSQACCARQLGAGHNLVLHAKVFSGDPDPPGLQRQIRLCECEAFWHVLS